MALPKARNARDPELLALLPQSLITFYLSPRIAPHTITSRSRAQYLPFHPLGVCGILGSVYVPNSPTAFPWAKKQRPKRVESPTKLGKNGNKEANQKLAWDISHFPTLFTHGSRAPIDRVLPLLVKSQPTGGITVIPYTH
ncbi:uncharacterized protein H6S33_003431 [Morchella sextelata]|uniref:uncharacterized protein n=1 Tax=Morchella sextelata TaxID=1174677 RepID=UPI001D05AB7B|nr:uncharacterized protein H6S33_003431 [Morchella sextelata]KAH0606597.1 hypothetical protein H6S33_003431 [Morchella sextelata]